MLAPVPAPTRPRGTGALLALLSGEVPLRLAGPGLRVAIAEVVDYGGGHDRHAGKVGRVADTLLFEPVHHAAGRRESEGAAAGQQQAVNALDFLRR